MNSALQILNAESVLRKQQEAQDELTYQNIFQLRSTTIQTYFIRMSRIHKIEFLTKLLDNIHSDESLLNLKHIIHTIFDKLSSYGKISIRVYLNYEKHLLDHDRALDPEVLATTIESDMKWFATIKEPHKVDFCVDLLRMSGSIIVRKVYIALLKCCNSRTKHKLPIQENVTSEENDCKLLGNYVRVVYDPKDPTSIDVEKKLKIWNDTITKYKNQIDSVQKDIENVKKNQDEIDWIQVLPIWIVKRIFSNLDIKTLKRIKDVNSYWNYAVSDLAKDEKARATLDKTLSKMKVNIDPALLNKIEMVPNSTKPKLRRRDLRMIKLYDRGAILNSMRYNDQQNSVEKSLITEAPKEKYENYVLPMENLTTFPRNIIENMPLYEGKPCFLKDLGFEGANDEQPSQQFSVSFVSTESATIIDETADLTNW